MAATQDISQSLDVLAQNVGSALVRAVDRWRAAGPSSPTIGHVLTYQGAATPPVWAGAGAGVAQNDLPSMPLTPDGTQNSYDFDVSGYAEVEIILAEVGFASGDYPIVRFSVDGGATFKSGAADYFFTFFSSAGQSAGQVNSVLLSRSSGTVSHNAIARLTRLRATRASYGADVSQTVTKAARRGGYARFDGPITDIRLMSNGGANFNAGIIRLVGLQAA